MSGRSRTKVIFQDFPGPGIFKKKNPGLSRRRGKLLVPLIKKCFITVKF